jgi:hypothetical protein
MHDPPVDGTREDHRADDRRPRDLAAVAIGNVGGGAVLVAGVYRLLLLRPRKA